MDFNWKSWCRFCGSAGNNVKCEISIDLDYYFQIREQNPKICRNCFATLKEFNEFIVKTERVNQLLCSLKNDLQEKHEINKLRSKFGFETLEIELEPKEQLINDSEMLKGSKKSKARHRKRSITAPTESFKIEIIDPDLVNIENKSVKPTRRQINDNPISKGDFIRAQTKIQQILETICHVCNENFSTMSLLLRHCMTEHNCKPQIYCICGLVIDKVDTYKKHVIKCCRAAMVPFQCDLCPGGWYTKTGIETHMKKMHLKEPPKNVCKTCGRSFKLPYMLRVHLSVHLPDELKKIHQCSKCDKKFSSIYTLRQHLNTHENVVKSFTCHLCAKRTNESLKAHVETHNTTLDFKCITCSKAFKTSHLLKIHAQSHLPRRFFCVICNVGFRRTSTLKKHAVVHTDEKPFPCQEPTCTSMFKRKREAVVHYNLVHLKRQQYVCRVCKKDFYYIRERLEHMRIEHPKEYEEHERRYKFFRKENQLHHD